MGSCWAAAASDLPGPASACGGSPGEPVVRAGATVANDSPDGCSAAGRNVAGAVGAVSTLADAAAAVGTIAAAAGVDLLPCPMRSKIKASIKGRKDDYFRGKYARI